MRQLQNYVEENVFRFLLDFEIQKALRLQYPVSVVCLTLDLPADNAGAPRMRHIAQTALRVLRATDVATTLSVDSTKCMSFLLIDAESRSLPRILSRVTEGFGGGAEEGCLSWSAGGSCYPQTATNGQDLLLQAFGLVGRAKAEGGSRFYLPS